MPTGTWIGPAGLQPNIHGGGGGPAADRYGIAWGSGTPSVADWDAMQAAGVQWVRLDVDWGGVESPKGTFNWARLDTIVSRATARSMKFLPMVGYTPAWARPGATDDKCPPSSNTDYQDFCDALAGRYFSQGVTVYELWNEPNLGIYWKPGGTPGASASGYEAFMAAGSTGIKNGRAGAKVVTAGLAPANTSGANIDPRTFLSGIYTAGGGPSFDAVGWHPYYWDASQVSAGANQEWMNWTRMAGGSSVGTNFARQIMVDQGDSAKPIWCTEAGGPTDVWSEAFQSSEVGVEFGLWKGYGWTTAAWGNAPLFWYHWRDINTAEAAGNHEMHFGLEHTDGSDKPAMAAYVTEAAQP